MKLKLGSVQLYYVGLLACIVFPSALSACPKGYFECFSDCCDSESFCNDSPSEMRCNPCSWREHLCGSLDVHKDCRLYCLLRITTTTTTKSTATNTTAAATASSSEDPDQDMDKNATLMIGLICGLASVLFVTLVTVLLCLVSKRFRLAVRNWLKQRLPQGHRWGPEEPPQLPPDGADLMPSNRSSDASLPSSIPVSLATAASTATPNTDDSRQPLLSMHDASGTADHPREARGASEGRLDSAECLEVKRPYAQGREESTAVRALLQGSETMDDSHRSSLSSSRNDSILSVDSTGTPPRARPPSGESSLSDQEPQGSPPPPLRQKSSDGGPPRQQGSPTTKKKPDGTSEQQARCSNHPCTQSVHHHITIHHGGHCNGCPGNGCWQGPPPGAWNDPRGDHDVVEGRPARKVPTVPPSATPATRGDASHPMQAPGQPECRDPRLHVPVTCYENDEYVLAPSGVRAHDQQMNIKRRPDDQPGMPLPHPPRSPDPEC